MKRTLGLVVLLFAFAGSASAQTPYTTEERLQGLQAWFTYYNHAYFTDSLPTNTLLADIHDVRVLGLTEWNQSGFYQIDINLTLNPDIKQGRATELHEMCHLSLTADEEYELDHGPKFKACMKRLMQAGAFDDLL